MPPKPGAPLPNTALIPHTPSTRRLLSRLTKDLLLELVLSSWLDPAKTETYQPNFAPVEDEDDDDDEDDDEEGGRGIEKAREAYEAMKRRAVKGKEVVERVVEREWRDGLNLLQIAELDYSYLLSHPATHKWTASTLHPLNRPTPHTPPPTPRFHAPTFTSALAATLRPLVSTHTFLTRHPTLPLHLLRLQLHPHPPTPPLALPPPKRIFWLAFPTAAPGYVYHNIPAGGGDGLRDVVRESVAAAVSREHGRFELRASAMCARTLEALCFYRGGGGGEGGMVGVWSVYAEGVEGGPLDVLGAKRGVEVVQGEKGGEEEKRRRVAEGRFGGGARVGDGRGLESVEFVVEDVFPGDGEEGEEEEWRPSVGVKLEGAHVFAGVRSLVEAGVVFDGVKMPGWMTGEGGVSFGMVRDGVLVKRRK
ncbi:uncharacterized protein H6S33_006468 [Morchella sextelata]|uniref:uncharacterized protein n=1 Tax=Morchella sextelata TaxID=1174677 RepID=UPI001D0545E9|nr:uncharacterized protein H6S33_006468 [Morchella sextelata]KAH0604800.1 hypothetical protein H6S33_006468 [Morchella sextelata]